MALARDRCICLRKFEYSETSQILTLFGREHGVLRAMAKGAHRRTKAGASKFDGGVDLLDNGQAVFTYDTARDLQTLTEWHLCEGHLELRSSLRAVYLGQYSAELVTLLLEEHDPHPELFDRFEQTLRALATPRREETFLAFQLELLRETGHLPELSGCTSCGQAIGLTETLYFSSRSSGVICRNCEGVVHDRISVDARLLRLLVALLRLPRQGGTTQRLPQLTRHQTDPLNRILADFVQYTLGRGLRLAPYVLAAGSSPALQTVP
jgi:DNA repair protein RecO (recombination protein O)